MKPLAYSPAHKLETVQSLFAVFLRSDSIENASGLLKEEMRRMDSLIMRCADATRLPAGGALAVDRTGFSEAVTSEIKAHPNISVIIEEVRDLPKEGITIIASGPLTSDALSNCISGLTSKDSLIFTSAAPIVTYESINMDIAFRHALW